MSSWTCCYASRHPPPAAGASAALLMAAFIDLAKFPPAQAQAHACHAAAQPHHKPAPAHHIHQGGVKKGIIGIPGGAGTPAHPMAMPGGIRIPIPIPGGIPIDMPGGMPIPGGIIAMPGGIPMPGGIIGIPMRGGGALLLLEPPAVPFCVGHAPLPPPPPSGRALGLPPPMINTYSVF